MLLINLKNYVKTERVVSLFDLTTNFNAEPEVIRDMLKLLMTKGKVRKRNKTNQCGKKCLKCHPHLTEMYEWIEIQSLKKD